LKKKLFLVLAFCLAGFTSSSVFAKESPLGLTGFGVYGSVGQTAGKFGSGIGLSLKWGSFPVVGLQYDLAASRVNASVDYYVIDAEGLAKNLSYFIGGGLYAGLSGNEGSEPFDMGLRIPVGLQFWPVKKLELFLAPVLTIPLFPAPDVGFGAEFGARIRF